MRDNDTQVPPSLAAALGSNDAIAGFSRLGISLVLTDCRQPDNPIVYVNEAFVRTTGYAREAALGRNCRFLQGPDTDKRDVDTLRTAVAEGRDVSVDILNYRANGTPFRNRLILSPILDDEGQPVFFIGIQKELKEGDRGADNSISAEHLQQIKSVVRRDVALILSSLRLDDPDRSGRELAALPRRLECLQLIYEEMKLAARARHAGQMELGGLLGRIATAIAHDEGRAGLRFVQSIESTEVGVETATRLSLILSECLHNAFTHAFDSMDEGRIELRVTRLTGGGARILLLDDGVGLPPNAVWPSKHSAGGRLCLDLLSGLDATLVTTRGAAGTIIVIDAPVDLNSDHKES